MRNLLIYIATILCCLLFLKSVDAAVVWDGGSAVQTYKNAVKFGTNEQVKVDGSGDLKFVDSNSVERPVSKSEADFLLNRSFEKSHSGSPALSWTLSGATGTVSTSSPIDGSQLLSLSLSSTLSLSQEITQTQFYPNVVSFSLWVKSSITDIQLCSTLATVEQECVSYDGSDQWKKLQVLVTAPSSGAMGLKLKTLSTTSGTILVDNGEFSSNPLKFASGVVDTEWVSYTPAISAGFGTTSNQVAKWRRVGDSMEIIASFTVGTVAASIASFSLPSGYEIDASKLTYNNTTASSGNIVGHTNHSQTSQSATFSYVLTAPATSATLLYFSHQSNSLLDKTIPVNGSNLTTSGTTFTFIAKIPIKNWKSKSDQILTANDVVSSETINWQFKSTAIVDSDPVGTYNTYSKASSSNTWTMCATAPTTLPNNSDGFYMDGIPYNTTSNCTTSIGKVVVKIGKGLKSHSVSFYENTNKGNIADSSYFIGGPTEEVGIKTAYDEKLGTLDIDSGTAYSGFNTVRHIASKISNASYLSVGYVHFAASKNPVISALDAVPRIDYSWENEFSARIQNNGTCTVLSENYDFIDTCTRTSVGITSITWKSGFFTQIPNIQATIDHTVAANYIVETYNNSTTGVTIRTANVAGVATDLNYSLSSSRQGSDYRSRGDAAAIIAQPTCYVKDVKASGVSGGNSSSNTIHTRALNTTSGNCSFLSLSSNQITLNAGTYLIEAKVSVYQPNEHQAFLYNVSDSTYSLEGQSGYIAAGSASSWSPVEGVVTIVSSKTFEIRQYISAPSTNGLGFPSDIGVNPQTGETYTQVKITKVR